jgi:hypothetical protein
MLRLAVLALLFVGCGDDGLVLDFSIPDQALEPLDLWGGIPDMAEHQGSTDGSSATACVLDSDCMTFVDDCVFCHCLALAKTAPIPACNPQDRVDCTNQDPCSGQTAMCISKSCELQ